MIASIKIGKLHIRGTLRHRYEKQRDRWEKHTMWKKWEIGLWFRKHKAIGKKDFKDISKWKDNLVNIYTIGLNFFVIKIWIDIDYGVMHLK